MIVDEEENEMTLRNTVDSLSEHEITLRERCGLTLSEYETHFEDGNIRWTHFE